MRIHPGRRGCAILGAEAAVARSAEIERAIRMWALGRGVPRAIRWLPPESFLGEQAPGGKLHPLEREHPEFFLPRPKPPRLPAPTYDELVSLREIGTPNGPSVEAALDILRRVRGTHAEIEAASMIEGAQGTVPDRVLIEAAFLLAANDRSERARRLLADDRAPPPPPPPPSGERAGARATISTADRLAREAQFIAKHRALRYTPPGFVAEPQRRPIDATRASAPPPALPAVTDREIARLVRFGAADGPSLERAIVTLRGAHARGRGEAAVRYVLSARKHAPLPEAVRTACAEILAELGDRARALEVLQDEPAEAPPKPQSAGIDVDAEIRERDAAMRAAEAEHVLARDVDRLGVRERHARFAAVARAAKLTVEAFRALGGRAKRDALRDAGRSLEEAGEGARAAEVYALGGDQAEAARLGVAPKQPPPEGAEAKEALAQIDALDRRGLRLVAVAAARAFLADRSDAEVAAFARGVIARLVRGPIVTLEIDGREERIALGETITIGRAGATIPLASPLVSRVQLVIRRQDGVAVVEDPGSHNGTWLAGARLAAPLPIGAGVDLAIAREIPVALREREGAIAIDVAGERYLAPLGPLVIGGVRVALERSGGEAVVRLRADEGVEASIGEAPIETEIELSRGDVVRFAGRTVRVVG